MTAHHNSNTLRLHSRSTHFFSMAPAVVYWNVSSSVHSKYLTHRSNGDGLELFINGFGDFSLSLNSNDQNKLSQFQSLLAQFSPGNLPIYHERIKQVHLDNVPLNEAQSLIEALTHTFSVTAENQELKTKILESLQELLSSVAPTIVN